jgi:hypothetical protein
MSWVSRRIMPLWWRRRFGPPWKRVMTVDGQLSRREARALYDMARAAPETGCIVEVGAYRGRSTTALGLGARAGARPTVYAVEPHAPFVGTRGGSYGPADREVFYRNVLAFGLGRDVGLVAMTSEAAASAWPHGPIGLLWLDGDHREEAVRREVALWRPHLVDGASVAFHDTDCEGVARVVEEVARDEAFERAQEVERIVALRHRA